MKYIQQHNKTKTQGALVDAVEGHGIYAITDHRPATIQRRKLQQAMQKVTASKMKPVQLSTGPDPADRARGKCLSGQLKGQVVVSDDVALKGKAGIMGARTRQVHSYGEGELIERTAAYRRGPVQLQKDEENDARRLGMVYSLLSKIHEKPALSEFKWEIYDILGYERNTTYKVTKQDWECLNPALFKPQNIEEAFKYKLKNGDTESRKLYALEKKKYEEIGKIDANIKIGLVKAAYEYGGYLAVYNDSADQKVSSERMVINVNNQKAAIDLINYLIDQWNTSSKGTPGTAWCDLIISAKFLGGSKTIQGKDKYDKIVLYYEEKHRNEILTGVLSRIPKSDRNEAIGAFYDKLDKGLGVGKEIDGTTSFTMHRSKTLARWIIKTWKEVKGMNKEEFIFKAKQHLTFSLELKV